MPAGRQPKDFPLRIRIAREVDGRWLAIIDDIPGVMAYGATRAKASAAVRALALRVAADLIEHGEKVPFPVRRLFSAA